MADGPRSTESWQRIQIGLTGLAGVVLLVGLANIVINNANAPNSISGAALNQPNTTTNATENKEPLAELGVTPSASSSGEPQVVPDLMPDPNLRKPMDRDPQQQGQQP